ncbi:endoribonuclease Dcr-2 [Anopheles bellator]|uniref:endoribonuclease Dcr-2 n=1 Tax=Anopheles bellator TaxID=139047 RepID=UPI002649D1DF|nr:endoribonuclease Dcr-2 [Anopheles bellator]
MAANAQQETSGTLEDFVPRDYQEQMKDVCLEKNTIVYLPTGAGKTYIALMVMRDLCYQLKNSIASGGKRTFFLANTVTLAKQQVQFFSRLLPFQVRLYTSEVNVDAWKSDRWLHEFAEVQVFVCTAQILLDVLRHGYLSPANINLIVFDECHRATGQHPMHAIMKEVVSIPKNSQPRIIGLSGTLLFRELKSSTAVADELERLENTFCSTIATVGSYDQYTAMCSFSTNAKETLCCYAKSYAKDVPVVKTCASMVMKFIERIEGVHLPKYNAQSNHTLKRTAAKPVKTIKRLLTEFLLQMEDLGIFGGSIAILGVIVQLELDKRCSESTQERYLYRCAITLCEELRHILVNVMKGVPERDQIKQFSTDHLRQLILYLEQQYTSAADLKKQSILFVQRRFSAKVLYHILKKYFELSGNDVVRSEFIVGANRALTESIELILSTKQDRRVLHKFCKYQINVLCATNVLEEGIDLQMCNIVIMFNEPTSYSSYMQSKGRARMKDSNYVMMVMQENKDKFLQRLTLYHEIEKTLKGVLIGKTINRPPPLEQDVRKELLEADLVQPFLTPAGAKLDMLSAIQLLNRYSMGLPHDLFTDSQVVWERFDLPGQKICAAVQLPLQSTVREKVRSEPMKNVKNAKRSAAFNACKKLYEAGELNLHLLPVSMKDKVSEYNDQYFQHWRSLNVASDTRMAGTAKNVRGHKVRFPIETVDCTPQAESDECYVYVLRMRAHFEASKRIENVQLISDLYNTGNSFGIMTRKPLPSLARMKLFVTLGTVVVDVMHDPLRIKLTDGSDQLRKLKRFHLLLFRNVLRVWKPFAAMDVEGEENGFLIVPLADSTTIDWELLDRFPSLRPAREINTRDRQRMVFEPERYLYRVIHPWYKNDPSQHYVVLKVHEELTPASPFPNPQFRTFEEYFTVQHNQVVVRQSDQFLIEVKGISSNLNLLHPGAEQDGSSKRAKHWEFQELLLPELCHNYEFPADYWLKATLLPCVLHRVHYLLLAEAIRCDLARSVQIGAERCERIEELSVDREIALVVQKADAHQVFGDSFDDESASDEEDDDDDERKKEDELRGEKLHELLENLNMNPSIEELIYPWKEEEQPLDLDRQWCDTGAIDIDYYIDFVGKHQSRVTDIAEKANLCLTERDNIEVMNLRYDNTNGRLHDDGEKASAIPVRAAIQDGFGSPGEINILKLTFENTANVCLQQADILQALTTKNSHDVFNLERFELLGDVFLKYSVSVFVLFKHTNWHEGYLTSCKGRMVSNRNLLYCAMHYGLPGMLKVHRFDPRNDWIPPLAVVPKPIREAMIEAKETPARLYSLSLSEEEVQTGQVQVSTVESFLPLITKNETQAHSTLEAVLQQVHIPDKMVADSMEALLGVCVKSVGYERSFRFLQHFNIVPRDADIAQLLRTHKFPVGSYEAARETIDQMLCDPDTIERVLDYRFRNRTYLLQAFTHATYSGNTLTGSYQQLEFLGDAVLDFLVTLYIFERNPTMSPGTLTDLRSALVNNVTLACVLVRCKLHRYILSRSPLLTDTIDRFVEVQNAKQNKIGDWVRLLTEESDTPLVEYVDVPKVLGDVFEALIGAIYLDSGCDLLCTWRVCYALLRNEINNFTMDTPIQVVRQLYEHPGADPHFSAPRVEDEVVIVKLTYNLRNQRMKVYGCGQNKEDARRAAAKLALSKLHN